MNTNKDQEKIKSGSIETADEKGFFLFFRHKIRGINFYFFLASHLVLDTALIIFAVYLCKIEFDLTSGWNLPKNDQSFIVHFKDLFHFMILGALSIFVIQDLIRLAIKAYKEIKMELSEK